VREDDPESADALTPAGTGASRRAEGRSGPDRAAGRGPEELSGPAAAELDRARALAAAARLPRRRSRQLLGSRRRQAFAGVVVLAAIGYIAYQGLTSAAQYFLTTKQAVEQRATLGDSSFRIEGTVEHDVRQVGSVIDFTIYADGVAVDVVSTGSPPQLFKPGIPVVLIGHWQGDHFASTQIMVKHTANYTEEHPDRLKSQLPSSSAKK
jgi:cytochrome c-type biogenesis protein CcmE